MEQNKKKSKQYSFSQAELRDFHKKGYAGPFDLYEIDHIKESWNRVRRAIFDRSKAVYGDDKSQSGVTNIANYDRHLDISFLARHVMQKQIVDRVSSILGPDLLCWRSEFFPKNSGDEGTDWHQADTFENASGTPQIVWPNSSEFGGTITVWTAFSDVTVEMGALQFIPETHQTMFYDETKDMHYDADSINGVEKNGNVKGFFGYDYRNLQIDPDWKPDESKAVSMEMNAGQFIIFWSTLMHGSHAHLGETDEPRMAFVARYVPTSVSVYPDTDNVTEYGGSISLENYGAVLACGENKHDHNRMVTHTTRGEKFSNDE
jgi:non-heme Fe2+,alpha-ketoglutarate-dependent halogenase